MNPMASTLITAMEMRSFFKIMGEVVSAVRNSWFGFIIGDWRILKHVAIIMANAWQMRAETQQIISKF